MGSARWMRTTSIKSNWRRSKDPRTDSTMCFLDNPLSSDLFKKKDLSNDTVIKITCSLNPLDLYIHVKISRAPAGLYDLRIALLRDLIVALNCYVLCRKNSWQITVTRVHSNSDDRSSVKRADGLTCPYNLRALPSTGAVIISLSSPKNSSRRQTTLSFFFNNDIFLNLLSFRVLN